MAGDEVGRWKEYLWQDGNGKSGTISAPNGRMAVGVLTPAGHHLVRDTKGEDDEQEHHNCRHCGWFMYFVVDDRGKAVDWFAITPKEGGA